VNEQTIAIGAAVLTASLILGTFLSRAYFTPSGLHRAPRAAKDTVPPAPMMRPQQAEMNDVGWCPAEQQERLHAYRRDGSRTCWACRCETPGRTA
jgi:hypothetical protein